VQDENLGLARCPPQTIFTSPESGPEGSASLLSSLDDLPTREMLGLPDRESSPEEMDDDDNNSLEHLFWIPPDVENPSNSLRPSSPALKPPSLVSEPVSYVSVLEPVSSVPIPEPMSSTSIQEPVSPTPAPEPPFTRISDCVNGNTSQLMFKKYQNSAKN
jgi:hypothetical protein